MTFNELKKHCVAQGCVFEHLGQKVYMVRDCINGNQTQVEDLNFYSITYLGHIFFQLKIDVPAEIQDFMHVYAAFRDNEGAIAVNKASF